MADMYWPQGAEGILHSAAWMTLGIVQLALPMPKSVPYSCKAILHHLPMHAAFFLIAVAHECSLYDIAALESTHMCHVYSIVCSSNIESEAYTI